MSGSSIQSDISLKSKFAASSCIPEKQKSNKKRPAPLSIRLTDDERERLEEMAAGQALSSYIKTVLFNGETVQRGKRGAQTIKDYQKLAFALGLLGKLGTFATLNNLLDASQEQRVDMDSEMRDEVLKACQNIRVIRCNLIAALGVKVE